MKFLMTYAQTSKTPPTPERMAAIAKLTEDMAASGVLLMTGGLQRPTMTIAGDGEGEILQVFDPGDLQP